MRIKPAAWRLGQSRLLVSCGLQAWPSQHAGQTTPHPSVLTWDRGLHLSLWPQPSFLLERDLASFHFVGVQHPVLEPTRYSSKQWTAIAFVTVFCVPQTRMVEGSEVAGPNGEGLK